MIKQGGGVVIDITSDAGERETPSDIGRGGWGLGYSISKAAYNRVAAGLGKELRRHNIAVINLEPGYVSTERTRVDSEDLGVDPEGRLGVDVPGKVCAYLASHPTPMHFSGRTIHAPVFAVDHGLHDGRSFPSPFGPSSWGLPCM